MSQAKQPWKGPVPPNPAPNPMLPPVPTPAPGSYGQPATGYPQPTPQPVQPGYPQPNTPNYPPAPQTAYPQAVQPTYPQAPQPGYPPVPQYPPQPRPVQPVQPGYPQPYPQQAAPVMPVQPAPYPTPAAAYPQPVRPAYPQPQQPVNYQYPTPSVPQAPMPVAPVPARPIPAQALPARPVPVPAAAPTPAPVSVPGRTSAGPTISIQTQPAVAAKPGAARPIPVPAAARPIPVAVGTVAGKIVVPTAADEDEQEEDVEQKIVRNAPPWLISLIVHAVAIVVLGLIHFATKERHQVELKVVYAEDIGVQLEDDRLTTGLMQEVDVAEPVLSKDQIAVDDPFAAPPRVDISFDGSTATDNIVAPSIGLALTGREKGMKQALLGKYGGNATTEASVRLGLEWLKKNQEKSGAWSLVGPYSSASGIENRCSATAMALIAFQGAGHTHKEGDFKKEVTRGWKALLAMQDRDGMFYHEGVSHQQLYAQAQATIAICELYGMTKDPDYKAPAQRAVDYAIKIQTPEGGWRYTPGSDSDTSVTGWFVIALQSAMMAGLEVPSPALDRISKFLDSVQTDNGTRYAYRPGSGPTETMTAEALLCRQYLEWKHDDPRLADGVKYLLNNPIRWDFENTNVYYWYYATQVMHHMEGDAWKQWNNVMRETIPKVQEKTGAEAGSWSPSNDRWGAHGGRLYETCLCIYMLEVYYRHLPIYKWKQQ